MSLLYSFKNHTIVKTVIQSYDEFIEEKALRHSAALSFYTLFSLVPILVITISVSGLFFGQDVVEETLFHYFEGIVGQENLGQFESTIMQVAHFEDANLLTKLFGILALVFSSTAIFYSIKTSINALWHIPFVKKKIVSTLLDRGISFLMLISVGFLIVALFLIESVLLSSFDFISEQINIAAGPLLILIEFGIGIAVNALIFGLIYRFLPDGRLSRKKLMTGAIVTAFLFGVGNVVISWYIHSIDMQSSYGVMGSLMLGLTWVFYSATMIFFGAKFIFVFSELTKDPIIHKDV